eukprot:CAMPEP_0119433232 /NCGR_PEP_ID=MMETSP1335-20130426/49269_1 /TAXON_ID=259385 /ORGANISM="Chrysoculter rhomboideus, Strain RCC1486" /LENGTH=106 /DNA_ID=CAMNT_0007459067 /DNA_START=38 /DNA_END=356 /DNA_ORIENTATION=+
MPDEYLANIPRLASAGLVHEHAMNTLVVGHESENDLRRLRYAAGLAVVARIAVCDGRLHDGPSCDAAFDRRRHGLHIDGPARHSRGRQPTRRARHEHKLALPAEVA